MQFGEFSGKEGDIISGVIQQGRNPDDVMVDLGKLEARAPGRRAGARRALRPRHPDQVPGASSVRKGMRGPQITLSRSHPNLVKKLFALEVPEIADGTVEIAAIAREAGHRTKIAVRSQNVRGQPQGCLHRPDGPAGAQRDGRAPRREDRHRRLVRGPRHACRPRAVPGPGQRPSRSSTRAARSARVVVPDFQLSLAIGKEGQNARLAARLTGWRIDIHGDEDRRDRARAPTVRPHAMRSRAADLHGLDGTSSRRVRASYGVPRRRRRTRPDVRRVPAAGRQARAVAGDRRLGRRTVSRPSCPIRRAPHPAAGRTCTPRPSASTSRCGGGPSPGPCASPAGRDSPAAGGGSRRQHQYDRQTSTIATAPKTRRRRPRTTRNWSSSS